jgi:hypothetical protein
MKRLLLSLTVFVFCLCGIGQKPESFDYQAIVHNKAGEVVVSQYVSLKFSILKGSRCDTIVYSESQRAKTNHFGSVSVTLGNGIDKTGSLKSIDWNSDQFYLKVELDPEGGSKYADLGTTQILNSFKTASSNTSRKTSGNDDEDKLFISRKYVGNFLDYRSTSSKTFDGINLIWIKTSMEKIYGKMSAYGKKCDFSTGDKLYIRRKYYSPGGISGYWMYQIENDSSVYYRLSDFQNDHKVLVETWFK